VGALVVVDVSSGKATKILDDSGGADDTPDWSADGRRIVFGRQPKGANDEDLYLINPDGSRLTRLTSDPGYEYSPDWSPDGRRIAFIREGDVWVVGADGRNDRRLTRGLKADSPAWSPDGRRIAFTVEKELWVMNADGSDKTRLDLGFDIVANPAWRPR
jgi:TolB protein